VTVVLTLVHVTINFIYRLCYDYFEAGGSRVAYV